MNLLFKLLPVRFFRIRGFYNPFIVIYTASKMFTEVVLGRQRTNNILQKLHCETPSEFLDWVHFPEYLAESYMVKEVQLWVKRKRFRHEPEVSSLLEDKKGVVFIDIGANVGYYSFLLHDNFDNVLAIEPHPKNVKLIEKMVKENGDDKVAILPIAISDKDREGKLYFGSHRGKHGLLSQGLKSDYLMVKTVTLDSLLETYAEVDLIKVDVEGAEWKVLDGAKNVIDKIISWVIELHDLTRKIELENLMKSFDYKIKWVDSNHLCAWKVR